MSNISFPSTSTVISQASFKPNQSSILGTVNASYIDGINIYIANNSAFSSSYVTINITTNTINPITIYNGTFTIEPQNVLIIQNIYNISNSTVSVFVSENNNTKGYIVYDSDYISEVPNSNNKVPLTQFSSSGNSTSVTTSSDNEQLTQLQYLITSQINNLTTQVFSLSSEVINYYSFKNNSLINLLNDFNTVTNNITLLQNNVGLIPSIQNNVLDVTSKINSLSSVVDSYYEKSQDLLNNYNLVNSGIDMLSTEIKNISDTQISATNTTQIADISGQQTSNTFNISYLIKSNLTTLSNINSINEQLSQNTNNMAIINENLNNFNNTITQGYGSYNCIAYYGAIQSSSADCGPAILSALENNYEITLGGGVYYLLNTIQLPNKSIIIDLKGGELYFVGNAQILTPDTGGAVNVTCEIKNGVIYGAPNCTQPDLIHSNSVSILITYNLLFYSYGSNKYYIGGNLSNSRLSGVMLLTQTGTGCGGINFGDMTTNPSLGPILISPTHADLTNYIAVNINGTESDYGVQGVLMNQFISVYCNPTINIAGNTAFINITNSMIDQTANALLVNETSTGASDYISISGTYLGNLTSSTSTIQGNGLAYLSLSQVQFAYYDNSNTAPLVDATFEGGQASVDFDNCVFNGGDIPLWTTVTRSSFNNCWQNFKRLITFNYNSITIDTSTSANLISLITPNGFDSSIPFSTIKFSVANTNTGPVTINVGGASYALKGPGNQFLQGYELYSPYVYEATFIEGTFILTSSSCGGLPISEGVRPNQAINLKQVTNGSIDGLFNSSGTSNNNTLSGITSGNITSSMPEQGYYKKFVASANNYVNDTTTNQTINFPTKFINAPTITVNKSDLILNVTTTTLTITSPNTSTSYNGLIIIEGF